MRSKTYSARRVGCVLVIAAFVVLVSPVRVHADWNVGDPYKMHYPQLPDLTSTGIDVLATRDPTSPNQLWKTLADDFRCIQTGPISDIHFWGSWLNDQPFTGVQFKLSIHADIPATPTSPSMPAFPPLWERVLAPSAQRLYSSGVPERFMNPNTGQIMGTDTQVWQYNFKDIPQPFTQEVGKIYWLDVQALIPAAIPNLFGWKTTNPLDPRTPHFMDDAVYWDTAGGGIGFPPIAGPFPLVYPAGGPFGGQSIDLSFVITPEPGTLLLLALGSFGLVRPRRVRPS
jgi:hypothetical protein